MSPTITIITVCKNADEFIETTIKSVISQTYSNKEYIIIDGASKDRTLEIISEYSEFIDCVVSEPDSGISDAFNKGIRRAHGDLIGIMNAGDCFYDENVLNQISQQYTAGCEIIQGLQIMKNYDTGYEYVLSPSRKYGHLYSLLRFYPNHMSTYIAKRVYEENGLYDLQYKICMDIEMLYRCHKNGVNITYSDCLVGIYRLGGISDIYDWRELKEKILILKKDGGKGIEVVVCTLLLFIKNITKIIVKNTCGLDTFKKKWYKNNSHSRKSL